MTTLRSLLTALLLSAFSACDEPDFPAYNELDGLRVLALRATPPDLVPGSSTTLDALVYDDGETVSQRWSICPWPSDPSDGYLCPVDQALWDDAWSAANLGKAPDLTLGAEQTAMLALPSDREGLSNLCRELLVRVGEAATLPPDCEGTWPWTARLAASTREDAVDAVLELPVLLQRTPARNDPPVLNGITIDGLRFAAEDPELQSVPLARDRKTQMRVSIGADQAQTYTPERALGEASSDVTPRREALTFTWFVASGETSRTRSIFREGIESLRKAAQNSWRTPKLEDQAHWFVVVRDNRGGVDFIGGRALFED